MRPFSTSSPVVHFGRRGACLLLAGLIWLLVAYSVYRMPLGFNRPPAPHEVLLHPWMRVAMWAGSALVGMVSAFLPQGRDRFGFFALMIMPAERAVSWALVILMHLYSWNHWLVWVLNPALGSLLHLLDHKLPLPPSPLAMSQFAAWAATCIFMLVISSWPEPLKVVLPVAAESP